MEHRLREWRKRRGLTLQQLAEKVGTSNQQVSLLESGKRRLTVDWAQRFARALDCPLEALIGSEEETPAPSSYAIEEEFTRIPAYDVAASAGHGAVVNREEVLYHLAFRTEWLHAMTNAPVNRLAVIQIEGDSMNPTLSHGDTVLVDMTQTTPRADGIFVLVYDDALVVKRLQMDPVRRCFSIISDNPAYHPIDNVPPEDIRVAGRAIWLGRRI